MVTWFTKSKQQSRDVSVCDIIQFFSCVPLFFLKYFLYIKGGLSVQQCQYDKEKISLHYRAHSTNGLLKSNSDKNFIFELWAVYLSAILRVNLQNPLDQILIFYIELITIVLVTAVIKTKVVSRIKEILDWFAPSYVLEVLFESIFIFIYRKWREILNEIAIYYSGSF